MMMDAWPRLLALSVACSLLLACGDRGYPEPVSNFEEQVLWDTESTDLAKALIPFVLDPPDGSTAEPLPIQWTEDGYPHLSDNDEWDVVRIEDEGFTVHFEIERGLDSDAEWKLSSPRLGWVLGGHHFHKSGRDFWRSVQCYPQKGDTNFDERRVFAIDFATNHERWFAVSIQIFDVPLLKKTVGDLLALLRKHYPTYQRLCRDIEKHIYAK